MHARLAMSFFALSNTLILQSYVLSGEIANFNSPNRELSNDLSDVVVRRRKVALHTSSHLMPTEA